MSLWRRSANDGTDAAECDCVTTVEDETLVVDATACDAGRPVVHRPCRHTAIDALATRPADRIVVRDAGIERLYEGLGTALLVAAGRFTAVVADRDPRLARVSRRDPVRAARTAGARAGPVSALAAETGLSEVVERVRADRNGGLYDGVAEPLVAPAVASARFETEPPADGRLLARRSLDTDAVVREYDTPEGRRYHLEPVSLRLDDEALATVASARERLAAGDIDGAAHPDRAAGHAVRAVSDEEDPLVTLRRVLHKHTRGYGVLEDLFADDPVSDVYATAPVARTPLRVVVDGVVTPTNVRLSDAGAHTLASRLRRESGRAFSRAAPTIDAAATLPAGRIRAAGVTDPATEGPAFAFRDHGETALTLPALVANDTLEATAAALLSVAVERGATGLVAGGRGAGKTTLLGALLWEVPPATRTVVVEDTPELPVERAQASGRDCQTLAVQRGDGPGLAPAAALRTALRLGEGALVIGEVRGEEAAVLYEAMRVGAGDGAVLGTVHGDGPAAVRERVVTDLGVAASAFADTDLVVTVEVTAEDGRVRRRVRSVSEVVAGEDSVRFERLFAPPDESRGDAVATGRVDRGNSRLVAGLARAGESYADVRATLETRRETLAELATTGRTAPDDLQTAYRGRGRSGTGRDAGRR